MPYFSLRAEEESSNKSLICFGGIVNFQHSWQQILFLSRKVHIPQRQFAWRTSSQTRNFRKASSFRKHNPQILLPLQNPTLPCGSPARHLLTQGVRGAGPVPRVLASQTSQAQGKKEMLPWVQAPHALPSPKKQWELCWLARPKPDEL